MAKDFDTETYEFDAVWEGMCRLVKKYEPLLQGREIKFTQKLLGDCVGVGRSSVTKQKRLRKIPLNWFEELAQRYKKFGVKKSQIEEGWQESVEAQYLIKEESETYGGNQMSTELREIYKEIGALKQQNSDIKNQNNEIIEKLQKLESLLSVEGKALGKAQGSGGAS